MPTYLLHGFRWPRPLIRIHIILQNLDDAAAEWLVAPLTTRTMLNNFRSVYPTIMNDLSTLQFVEQYDPTDERAESKSQPFAYVADIVHEVKLGVDIDEIRGKGVTNEAWGAMVELRDGIAPGEKVAWFVVVCGDTERYAPPTVPLLEGRVKGDEGMGISRGSRSSGSDGLDSPTQSKPSALKRIFGGKSLKRSKSSKSLNSPTTPNMTDIPPVPRINGGTSPRGIATPPRTATSVQSPPSTSYHSNSTGSGAVRSPPMHQPPPVAPPSQLSPLGGRSPAHSPIPLLPQASYTNGHKITGPVVESFKSEVDHMGSHEKNAIRPINGTNGHPASLAPGPPAVVS